MMAESLFPNSADDAGPRAELSDPERTVRFMLAGNAHVTFQSRKTGRRFTYRVRLAKRRPGDSYIYFVSVLSGSDNDHSYEYLGCIYSRRIFGHGRKSKISKNATSTIAFMWVWNKLTGGEMHPELAVYHEGRCGRCNRRLTDPVSISAGIGPECMKKADR